MWHEQLSEPRHAEPVRVPRSWSDSSARSVLQLMVESVTEMIGFEVAALSVVLDDDLVTVAYAGPEEFREQAMTTDPVGVLDPVLAQAEVWGRFRFLAAEDLVGELDGTWIETATASSGGPEAWQSKDALLGVLSDETGELLGIISVDRPLSTRRPDVAQRRLLERYAAQIERAVLTAFEREHLVQQVAHAESARRLIRSSAMSAVSAQASLDAVLLHSHRPLVEGFGARGSWVEVLGPAPSRRGCARSRSGAVVALSESVIGLADQLAPLLWDAQRVLVLTDGELGDLPSGSSYGISWDDVRHELRQLGIGSLLAVPLGVGEECVGFLALTRLPQDPSWSEVEIDSALQIGHDLGTALTTARALERERDAVLELQQLDAYRTQLIATLSHEMRTPLTVISGNLEMLCEVDLDASASGFRGAMVRGTARMQRVVDDLLLLATLSHPQHPLERAQVDLHETIHDVVFLLESEARAKGISLRVVLADAACVIALHAGEIDRMLSNLVSNALKYTPAGGTVTISAALRENLVELQVSDNGLGISESDQLSLFTSFYRSTNPEALRESGTGLGLAIVAHIAQRHGGTVQVRSRLGEGATFTVLLPT